MLLLCLPLLLVCSLTRGLPYAPTQLHKHSEDDIQREILSQLRQNSIKLDRIHGGSRFLYHVSESIPEGCYNPDKDPSDDVWLPLLDDPCSYLAGPHCDPSHTMARVGVVGAGMAGLTVAWVLQKIGHQVVLIEAEADRVGGRVHTYYGDGWYGDLGAMRFPPRPEHPCVHGLIDKFLGRDVMHPFTMYGQGEASFFYVFDNYIKTLDFNDPLKNQIFLKEVYKAFGCQLPVMGDTGRIVNPLDIFDILKNPNATEMGLKTFCQLEISLENFLEAQLKDGKLTKPIGFKEELTRKDRATMRHIWATMELTRAWMPHSLNEFLSDAPKEKEKKAGPKFFMEIENGTSMLPNAIFEDFVKKGGEVIRNFTVSQVSLDEYKVLISAQDGYEVVDVDFAVVTATARAVSNINFIPPLLYEKTDALNSITYVNSLKIFLSFDSPFWINKTGIADPIPFYSDSDPTCDSFDCLKGGTFITDLPTRSGYYPAHEFHGYSMLVSYVWGEDADRLTSYTDQQLFDMALDNLVTFHGPVARQAWTGEGVVKRWMEDNFSHGAFVFTRPFQQQDLYPALSTPDQNGRLHFAGEYTNKKYHGWIESAVESAFRTAWEMFCVEGAVLGPPEKNPPPCRRHQAVPNYNDL